MFVRGISKCINQVCNVNFFKIFTVGDFCGGSKKLIDCSLTRINNPRADFVLTGCINRIYVLT